MESAVPSGYLVLGSGKISVFSRNLRISRFQFLSTSTALRISLYVCSMESAVPFGYLVLGSDKISVFSLMCRRCEISVPVNKYSSENFPVYL